MTLASKKLSVTKLNPSLGKSVLGVLGFFFSVFNKVVGINTVCGLLIKCWKEKSSFLFITSEVLVI